MHEAFRRRLEVLEEARKLQQRAAAHGVISIVFHGLQSTYAEANGFVCYRRADEDLADFESRAEVEVLASNPRPQVPPILVFHA